ncbi:mannitol dehydrogenase family protein [Acidisoma cellulosilyticum]|uniref:mannitol dehydrogenase family protein n=1 Tax=Acidisoma cellulosilyticum TaxID=2802395 RepID=UPI001D0AAE99|nr:mannitol dehydrogenase family protein [Acidisoma cellulosilyticum]
MIKLSNAALSELPPGIQWAGYDRSRLTAGIVHFSVGNFHRAHQAVYLDRLIAGGGHDDWALCGVGLLDDPRERAKAAAFPAQDCLYTLTVCPPHGEPEIHVIGSIVEYLFAPDDPEAVLAKLCDPAIRIVTMTLTEGGYNIDDETQEFKTGAPDIVHDLANPTTPRTAFGYVAEALARRRAAGLPAFTVQSCDNLRHNGHVAKTAFVGFARARDPELAAWMEQDVDFPNSMVDRITPATSDADRTRLNTASDIEDEIPVFCEDFIQWVVQDQFRLGRPAWEKVDAQITDDVWAYEQIKLRMLNSSHSMLAFPGTNAGYRLVHETVADPLIAQLLFDYWNKDVIPLLQAPPGMSLEGYRDKLMERYSNPATRDQTIRIATDGASRIPIFSGDTIRTILEQGGDFRRLAFLVASFAFCLGGVDDKGVHFSTPEPRLSAAEHATAQDPDPMAFLTLPIFAGLGMESSPDFVATFQEYRESLTANGTLGTLKDVLAG